MPRKASVQKRNVLPDPRFGDKQLAKFINNLMLAGKKSTAEQIVYGAFEIIEKRMSEEPLKIFKKALENIRPMIEVKSRRVGGSTYQVPIEVRSDRQMALAMRWLIDFTRKRSEKSMQEKLAAELMDAAANRGTSIKKREDTHKMAEANKAFAHYRW